MFDKVRDYLYQRRKGLATAAGFVGGLYLAGRYLMERLEEVREQVVQEKTAREKYVENATDMSSFLRSIL